MAQVQQAGNGCLALSSGTSSVPSKRQRQKSQHPPESEAQGRAALPGWVAGWGGSPFGAGHPAAPSQHTHTLSSGIRRDCALELPRDILNIYACNLTPGQLEPNFYAWSWAMGFFKPLH